VAADLFAAHLLQDEQTEKRYLRLLEQLATTSLQERAASLSELLSEALAIVADAVSADGALLVLHDPRTNAPAMTAAAGIARGITLNEATELASIECLISSHEAPLPDAATQIDLPGAVRAHGIESALGVSMPVRHRVTGVLYACMKDRRALDARDVRRLDVMGDALSLHVDNAQLVTELRHAVDALNTERTVRERFVAVLAHDLRGPLSTAMLNMTALSHDADPAKARAAHRIVRSLRRAARMVENLLDANRLHAGEPLALHKQPCDLVALTHEVLRDLTDAHGARFLVTADEGHVEGTWDADYLQRALWNLCVNAVQYGARERPIRVRIHASKDTVDLSVHNEGSFIAEEDRERLFEPYARGPADAAAARGWGLGLSLVRGCAVAHGGRVDLASSRADGTTFTMELPREPTDGRHDSVTAPPLQLASSYVAVR
jgi:K+-sensing histidine kinase KdpD